MIVQGSFSNMLAPGIRKVFDTAFNEAPQTWNQFFNKASSNRAYEEDASWAGFEPFQNFGELEDIPLRSPNQGFTTRYVHRKWGSGYQLSREQIDDNLYGLHTKFPAALARAFRATQEAVAASVFNLGFSVSRPGGDGVSLFNTAHPLYGLGGGQGANTFNTPRQLSHSALKDAIIEMRRTRADDGIFTPTVPRILLVPDALEMDAKEILRTTQVPYSDENTINVLQDYSLQVVPWSYLTSDDTWFLLAPPAQTELHFFERWPLRQVMKDLEENQSALHLAYTRFSFGWSHWIGTFGVEGS
jgi:phage major head subunit gpT-like protein